METFTLWKANFKSKMNPADWTLQTAEIWAMALADMGWSENAHKLATRKAMQLEWPPSSAKEFHRLAILVMFDDAHKAYQQACSGRFRSAAAYETTQRLGGSRELHMMDTKLSWIKWQSVYDEVCGEIIKGAVFTQPQTRQIEQKQPEKPSLSDEMQSKLDRFFGAYGKKKRGLA